MDKRAFIKSVRGWQADAVKMALVSERSLANYNDKIGKTPLHHCAEIDAKKFRLNVNDSVKTARALLSAGADVNAVRVIIDDGEEFYATPLWYAVAWGKNYDLAHLFLESGARADDNAIGSAIWDQSLKTAELLRRHEANIDHVSGGQTPLLRTVKARRMLLLKWLTDHGADINFQDTSGFTALHYAVMGSHTLAEIEELLGYGANPKLEAGNGKTTLALAQVTGKPKLVKLLASFG